MFPFTALPLRFRFHPSLFALLGLFALFGLIIGSWASRIPALRDSLEASHSSMAAVLFCGGLGAVLAFPVTARLMCSVGGRRALLYSGAGLIGALLAIGCAATLYQLMGAVLAFGMAASVFDVAVNAAAVELEKRTGRSQMSRLHGWFCAGGLMGAGIGSLMASSGISPDRHFAVLAGPMMLALWSGHAWLAAGHKPEKGAGKRLVIPRGPVVALGVLGFMGAMSEGSIADWSGLFLKDEFGVADGSTPLALAAFSLMMLAARTAGDRLKESYGAQRLIVSGALLSAVGLLGAVCAPSASFAILGFAASGFGLAVVFPFVFSAAGKEGPVALAGVATMAYSGSLMGPPVIGMLAHYFGMDASIGAVGLLSLAIAMMAARTGLLSDQADSPAEVVGPYSGSTA